MPRPLRIHVPDGFYHVTLRGNHQQDIFSIESDRALLNTIVVAALLKHEAEVHAYCWMTNHLHLLIKVGTVPLGSLIRQIAAGYARAYQKRLETTGHLFERRYYASIVDTEAYFLELLRYIHLNPVSAGLVPEVDRYRWTSHHVYVGGRSDPWVTPAFALQLFSPDPSRRVAMYLDFLERGPRTTQVPLPPGGTTACTPGTASVVATLAADASRRFGIPIANLHARVRNPKVAMVRAWVAKAARDQGLASLSEVARFFGCDQAALRHAMERFRRELAEAG